VDAPRPEDLLGLLQRVFGEEFEIPADEIVPAAYLTRDLDLDSLDVVAFAARLEEETSVWLSEDELRSLDTVASVLDLVQRRLQSSPGERS
jgi:acyl carrier protein